MEESPLVKDLRDNVLQHNGTAYRETLRANLEAAIRRGWDDVQTCCLDASRNGKYEVTLEDAELPFCQELHAFLRNCRNTTKDVAEMLRKLEPGLGVNLTMAEGTVFVTFQW